MEAETAMKLLNTEPKIPYISAAVIEIWLRNKNLNYFNRLLGVEPSGNFARSIGATFRHGVSPAIVRARSEADPAAICQPYVKRGKNDAADAEALCEAMCRPTMRFVPVKTAEQQTALMLVGLRDRLIRNRTQLANAVRGYAAEFGLIAAKGICKIEPLLARIAADEELPTLARELFTIHARENAQLQERLQELEAKLMVWHRADECSRRLAQIPGVGPIGASTLVMRTPAPEAFRSARHFAA